MLLKFKQICQENAWFDCAPKGNNSSNNNNNNNNNNNKLVSYLIGNYRKYHVKQFRKYFLMCLFKYEFCAKAYEISFFNKYAWYENVTQVRFQPNFGGKTKWHYYTSLRVNSIMQRMQVVPRTWSRKSSLL